MTTLAPDRRVDFGEALVPPEGFRLEAALGTTFSMDIATALTVPVALALRGGVERDELLETPLAALAAMRRLQDRVMICVEAGNIHPPSGKRNALIALLEDIVTEVQPPKGASFHPKLWLLRFAPDDGGPMRQRLVMMSRNLTRDRSWDVALRLEGEERDDPRRVNTPLVGLLDWMMRKPPRALRELRDGLAKVRWDRVPGFGTPVFHAHHPGATVSWRPGNGKLAVISPFCDDAALEALGRDRIAALVSCDDWLAGLAVSPPRCLTLADHALPEADVDVISSPEDRAGLHAKLYVVEQGDETAITIGSGNATAAGLAVDGMRNIEVFATLRGRTDAVGGIGLDGAGILGEGGLRPLLQDWVPREIRPEEAAQRHFDDAVRAARRAIFDAKPRLVFAPDGDRLTVALSMTLPKLPQIVAIRARLATQSDGVALEGEGPWNLGSVRLADATSFVQIDLTGPEGEAAGFVTQARSDGRPDNDVRLRALLSDMVRSPEQLLAFVTAMLDRRPDIDGMMRAASQGGSEGTARPTPPVLESLLAAFLSDDGPARLRDLDKMIGLMAPDAGDETMKDFLALWAQFQSAMGKRS